MCVFPSCSRSKTTTEKCPQKICRSKLTRVFPLVMVAAPGREKDSGWIHTSWHTTSVQNTAKGVRESNLRLRSRKLWRLAITNPLTTTAGLPLRFPTPPASSGSVISAQFSYLTSLQSSVSAPMLEPVPLVSILSLRCSPHSNYASL